MLPTFKSICPEFQPLCYKVKLAWYEFSCLLPPPWFDLKLAVSSVIPVKLIWQFGFCLFSFDCYAADIYFTCCYCLTGLAVYYTATTAATPEERASLGCSRPRAARADDLFANWISPRQRPPPRPPGNVYYRRSYCCLAERTWLYSKL